MAPLHIAQCSFLYTTPVSLSVTGGRSEFGPVQLATVAIMLLVERSSLTRKEWGQLVTIRTGESNRWIELSGLIKGDLQVIETSFSSGLSRTGGQDCGGSGELQQSPNMPHSRSQLH